MKHKPQKQVMVFWTCDEFPYIRGGLGEKCQSHDQTYWVKSAMAFVSAKFTMPIEDGMNLRQSLRQLEGERLQTLESIEEGFQARLLATLTAHGV